MPLFDMPTQIFPGLDMGGVGDALDSLRPYFGMGLSRANKEAILLEEEKKKKAAAAIQMLQNMGVEPRAEWMEPSPYSEPAPQVIGDHLLPPSQRPIPQRVQASVPAPPAPGIPGDEPSAPRTVDDAIAELAGIRMEQQKRLQVQRQLEASGRAERVMTAREAALKRFVEGYNASNEGMDTPYGPNARGSYTSGNLDGSMPAVNRELYAEDLQRHRFNDDVRFGRVNPGRLSRMEQLNAADDIKRLEYEAAKKENFDRVLSETNGGRLVGPRSEGDRMERLQKKGGIEYHRAIKTFLEDQGATDSPEYKNHAAYVDRHEKLRENVGAMKTRMADRAKRIREENEKRSAENQARNREMWLANVPRDSALGGEVEGNARVGMANATAAGNIESIRMMQQSRETALNRIAEREKMTPQQVLADPGLRAELDYITASSGIR